MNEPKEATPVGREHCWHMLQSQVTLVHDVPHMRAVECCCWCGARRHATVQRVKADGHGPFALHARMHTLYSGGESACAIQPQTALVTVTP